MFKVKEFSFLKNFKKTALIYFIVIPISVMAHEVGHAIFPALKGLDVSIRLFSLSNYISHFEIYNLSFFVDYPLKTWVGVTNIKSGAEFFDVLMGPLISLILCGVSLYIFCKSRSFFSRSFAIAFGVQFLITFVPVDNFYKNVSTDGCKIVKKLGGRCIVLSNDRFNNE